MFEERRRMPRVVFGFDPQQLDSCILASCDINYFKKYALCIINSMIKAESKTNLVINCVNFSISEARQICLNSLGHLPRFLYFMKSETQNLAHNTEILFAYYRTIRFYASYLLHLQKPIHICIIDVDSIITSKRIDTDMNALFASKNNFVVGSNQDLFGNSLYSLGQKNYLWRIIKAGFTYFSNNDIGRACLLRTVNCLFNIDDGIPPVEELKLYRAYYGDQLALLFCTMEFRSNKLYREFINCIGWKEDHFISFDTIKKKTSLWIPPGSKRDEKIFDLFRIS